MARAYAGPGLEATIRAVEKIRMPLKLLPLTTLGRTLGPLLGIALAVAGCSTGDVQLSQTPKSATYGFSYAVAKKSPIDPALSSPLWREVKYHDAEADDYEIGSMHTEKVSIETRAQRADFRATLEVALAKSNDKMPDEGKSALVEAIHRLKVMDVESPSFEDVRRLHETVEAYNLNFQAPVPRKLWIGAVPYEAAKMIHHSIMTKRAPEAVDLATGVGSGLGLRDSSLIDPKPSAFWKPGRLVSQVDMARGFGREAAPKINGTCKYLKPKKSYGTHGGFTVDCDGVNWKMKFGVESKTEPFNSRLAWALGYPVTPIDYFPAGVRLAYDRKVITEYSSRKDLKMRVEALPGVTLFSHSLQVKLNPFEDAILGAELEDGTQINSAKLQAKLLRWVPSRHGKPDWLQIKDAKVNEEFEKRIKFLVLREGSLEGPKPENQTEIGEWSWNSLDHADRRELRGFAMVMAWVNGFDLRANNNKTLIQKNADGSSELVQMVADLGTGFGTATDLLNYNTFFLNKLPWDLVRLRSQSESADRDSNDSADELDERSASSASDWISPYKFTHYSVIESNKTFSRVQVDDAKWMIRKLASLSEDQIREGLKAAGFTPAELRLTLEKLLCRRQQLVDVFGLAKEFPDVMKRRIDRSISAVPVPGNAN